jgi:hypothetical protein
MIDLRNTLEQLLGTDPDEARTIDQPASDLTPVS